ncbi:MAG: hypothetical protein GC206_14475 [Alphaproteobacteria bacterium]|nr:hypothetical protein [Alphaproteobacteria bacterium]
MVTNRKRLSVVIIGPMADREDGAGVPISAHLPNIAEALRACNERFAERNIDVQFVPVSAHDLPSGDIPEFAFLSIDQADLAIADISQRSANVFYELSMLHALGRPTIVIDNSAAVGDLPFYLRRLKVVGVDDFTVERLTPSLLEALSAYVASGSFAPLRSNPIEHFYGSALVDASAASGIATGYFYNFVRRVIANDYGLIARLQKQGRRETKDIRALCVVLPTTLNSVNDDQRVLEGLPTYFRGREYKDADFFRPMVFNTAGPYITDYATPLIALTVSTSYIRLRRLLGAFPVPNFVDIDKFEQRLIAAYRETITRLVEETAGMNPSRVKFATPQELSEEFSG